MRALQLVVFAAVAVLLASGAAAAFVPRGLDAAGPGAAPDPAQEPDQPPAAAPGAPPAVPLLGPGGWGAPREDSLAPAARNEVVVLTDEAGDVTPFGIDELPGIPPGVVATEHVDIRSLTLLETEEAVLFQLRHEGYPDPMDLPDTGFLQAPPWYGCTVEFEHGGAEYQVRVSRQSPATEFYLLSAGLHAGGEWLANIPVALVASERLEVLLPKHLMAGGGLFEPLAVGSPLTEFTVMCQSSSMFFAVIGDRAEPGDGDAGAYVPGLAAVRPEIAAAFHGQDRVLQQTQYSAPRDEHYARFPMSVPPGDMRDARAQLIGRSLEAETRVTVKASVVDEHGANVPDWSVLAPPTIAVTARTVRSVPILVTAPADAAHGDTAFLLVEFAIGDHAVAIMRPVVAAWDPAPSRGPLYFHGDRDSGVIVNALENDPRLEQGVIESTNFNGIVLGGFSLYAEMDTPFSERRPLRGAEPIVANLVLAAEQEIEAWISVEVYTSDGDTLAYSSASSVLRPTPSPVEVRVEPDLFAYAYEAGDRLSVRVLVGPYNFEDFLLMTGVSWHLEGSSLTLPFSTRASQQAEENGVRIELASGPTHLLAAPSMHLAVPIVVTNLGASEQQLNLTGGSLLAGWALATFPDGRFRLGGHESIAACIEIWLPEAAAGATVVAIDAMRAGEDERLARLPVTLHVAAGAEMEESTCALMSASARGGSADLSGGAREAPGPVALLVGVLVALGVALRRRR